MRIASAAGTLPDHQYDQRVLLAALRDHWGAKLDNPLFLDRLHARVGVDTRYLALPMQDYYGIHTWGQANNHWIEAAVDLAEKALSTVLERAGISKELLGAIFFVSVTGVCSPSIDARLVNRMKLPARIKRVPIFGLGCVAGAAGWRAPPTMFGRIRIKLRLWSASSCVRSRCSATTFDCESDFVGIVRRWCGRGVGGGEGRRVRRPADSGDAFGFLSRYRRRDGLGHF